MYTVVNPSTTVKSQWIFCSICNVYYIGFHDCNNFQPIEFTSLLTIDRKLDRIIELLEIMARKVS